jgi:quinoprotein glucose dehydrogenase
MRFGVSFHAARQCLTAALFALAAATPHAAGQNRKSWIDYGGGGDNSHFTPLTQIDKANVDRLQIAWSYPQGSTGFNPIVAGNTIYVLSAGNSLTALDAVTGKEIWLHANLAGITARGINYWESKDHKDRRLIFSMNNMLQEIDGATGKSILTFGKDGFVDLREGLGRDPSTIARIQSNTPGKVFENLVILGSAPGEAFLSPPGDLRAYDVLTGKLVWQFHTIPHPGEFGYETVPKDGWKYLGGGNTWGEITVDEKRAIAYFPLGSLTYDFYGADRPGSDLFGDCLLALDARTGKRLWHYQMVHHDLWDYDNTSAPQLITVRKDGKTIEAVAQAGKTGFLYVFDRVTGQPLWPIEERPVPKSDVPGEKAWPTQPFPTTPPPFSRQKFTVDDISPYLPDEERAVIKDQILSARNEGIFTPPSFRGTVSMPGNQGGSNWGTTAADPAKGIVYVLNVDEPAYLKLDKDPPINGGNGLLLGSPRSGRGGAASSPGQTLYAANCQGCHGEDRGGSAAVPSLVNIVMRMPADAIKTTVTGGKGQMPAFTNFDPNDLNVLIAYLANPNGRAGFGGGRGRGRSAGALPSGPVVESGAPPAAQQAAVAMAAARASATNYGNMQGPPYPVGIDSPPDRFFSGWGVSEDAIGGPFSTLVAYDLNQGVIKWRVPVGDDPRLLKQGVTGTGSRGLRTGIIPTASGLVFIAGGDGKIRAYDEDTGKVLWEHAIGGTSRGIPVIYEANGREYLVISATAGGRGGAPPDAAQPSTADLPSDAMRTGYVAFSLPAKSK